MPIDPSTISNSGETHPTAPLETPANSASVAALIVTPAAVGSAVEAMDATQKEAVRAAMGFNGTQTISGAKTFSGQVDLTGQAATNPTSAMNRGLCDMRYLNRDVRMLTNDTGWQSSNTGSGTSSSGTQLAAASGATSGGIGHIRTGGSAPWIYTPPGHSLKSYDFSVGFSVGFTISVRYGSSETTYASTEGYLNFGQARSGTSYGPITTKGFAIKFSNGVCYGQSHDGTTLRTTASPLFTAVGDVNPQHRVDIVNHGNGTVSFYVDGVFKETLTGPTGAMAGTDYSATALMSTTTTAKTFEMFVNYPITITYP